MYVIVYIHKEKNIANIWNNTDFCNNDFKSNVFNTYAEAVEAVTAVCRKNIDAKFHIFSLTSTHICQPEVSIV